MAQEVPCRLRPRIFFTFRHYKGGRSSAKRTGRLYPRRNPWYSLSGVESASGHVVLSGVPRKKSPVTPPGIDPGTVLLVAQRLNHYYYYYYYYYVYCNAWWMRLGLADWVLCSASRTRLFTSHIGHSIPPAGRIHFSATPTHPHDMCLLTKVFNLRQGVA